MTNFLRTEIMKIIQAHRGRENTMPRRDLWAHLSLFKPKLTDREMRDLYSALPICSCKDGLFLPVTAQEVQEFREYIEKAWGPIVAHRWVAIILSFYPRLAPTWKQQNLFGGTL